MNRFEIKWLYDIVASNDGVKNTKILVACSGGGDSVALLTFLWAIRKNLGITLVVAHANHGLRQEADLEAALVRKLCHSMRLELFETQLEVRNYIKINRMGLETAARELRWNWLKELAVANKITVVATGHNLNDHTETVLLRLTRGGGAKCITPLHRRQNLRWSPLIQVKREELREYLKQKNITWLEDVSNDEGFTSRNRWRKLLEPLRTEAPNLDNHLWETHLQVTELINFRNYHVQSWRGIRWEIIQEPNPILLFGGCWNEVELRWTLEAAFKECLWHRESNLLRNLTMWLMSHLHRKPKSSKKWSGWCLESTNNVLNRIANNKSISINKVLPWALYK